MSNTFGPCGEIIVEGGVVPKLAQNLNVNLAIASPTLDTTGSLTEMINASGRFLLDKIQLNSSTAGDYHVQLIIDGEIIWDDTVTTTGNNQTFDLRYPYLSEESIVFNLQAATDTSVFVTANAMPTK